MLPKKEASEGRESEHRKKFNLLAFYEPKSKSLTIIKKRKATRRGLVWPMAKKGGGLDRSGRGQREIKREGRGAERWKGVHIVEATVTEALATALWLTPTPSPSPAPAQAGALWSAS